MFTAAIVTVSDRRSAGKLADQGGPLLRQVLEKAGYQVVETSLVPDEIPAIQAELLHLVSQDRALILTTGGTGLAPRDVTPEATAGVCEKIIPGIGEFMRSEGFRQKPKALFSRALAGICQNSLILNLPGRPQAAQENLLLVLDLLGEALKVLRRVKDQIPDSSFLSPGRKE